MVMMALYLTEVHRKVAFFCVLGRCHVLLAVEHHMPSVLMRLSKMVIPFVAIGLYRHCPADC